MDASVNCLLSSLGVLAACVVFDTDAQPNNNKNILLRWLAPAPAAGSRQPAANNPHRHRTSVCLIGIGNKQIKKLDGFPCEILLIAVWIWSPQTKRKFRWSPLASFTTTSRDEPTSKYEYINGDIYGLLYNATAR